MCGIVGYVGKKRVVPVIIEGLRKLEYRGYDSAGIAVAGNGDGLQIRRAEGKLRNLEEVLRTKPLDGTYGIGHTRWATHGRPSEENAHPHRDCTGRIVVVHNGIVENYLSLKKKLAQEGHTFTTETDTEIIAHLVEKYLHPEKGNGTKIPLEEAVRKSPTAANQFALATAYQMEKHPEKAEPLLAAALKEEPGNVELHASYGRSLRDQKKYVPAAQEFSRVVEARPQSIEAWGDLSAMLILLNQDTQALAALDRIRALGGEKPGHFYFRAIILDRNKQLKGALENYEKFLSVSDGKNPDEEFKARQRVRIIKNELAKR